MLFVTELTKEEEAVVNRALRGGPADQVLVEGFKLQICRRDIITLSGLNWLNDEVLDNCVFMTFTVSNSCWFSYRPVNKKRQLVFWCWPLIECCQTITANILVSWAWQWTICICGTAVIQWLRQRSLTRKGVSVLINFHNLKFLSIFL